MTGRLEAAESELGQSRDETRRDEQRHEICEERRKWREVCQALRRPVDASEREAYS